MSVLYKNYRCFPSGFDTDQEDFVSKENLKLISKKKRKKKTTEGLNLCMFIQSLLRTKAQSQI